LLKLGYRIPLDEGGHIAINAAAYADDLILYTETHEDMYELLRHLEDFCKFAKMKVNADKCVSISQVWSGRSIEADMNPFYIQGTTRYDEIPMEFVSIYLGMPIGLNRYENSKH
jgi:hypothetical protein